MPIRFSRIKHIAAIRKRLERDSYPRLQMSLLVMMTAAIGFVSSYLLLRVGLTEMWIRYLVAISIAYLAFLLLLWLWLRTRLEDYLDITNLPDAIPLPGDSGGFGGGGGSFGGGGASSSFDAPASSMDMDSGSVLADDNVVGEAVSAVADADELAIPLIVLIFVISLLLSSLFVIYSAPVLFAELMFDGVLAAGLYRRLRGIESQHWLKTALRRTIWPFVLTAITVSLLGWAMAYYVPGAQSIGDVF